MWNLYRTAAFERALQSLSAEERGRILRIEAHLRLYPLHGKPLGYTFFREKRMNEKRLLFLIYPDIQAVCMVALTDKKRQEDDIQDVLRRLTELRTTIMDLNRPS